jgi:hypothetical protein
MSIAGDTIDFWLSAGSTYVGASLWSRRGCLAARV